MALDSDRTQIPQGDVSFGAFVKQSRRRFDNPTFSLNLLSRSIKIGVMNGLYPDNVIIDANNMEVLQKYDYGSILSDKLSPYFTSLSEEPLTTPKLKKLVINMLIKYQLLQQFAKQNLLSEKLVNFANNLSPEQVLVLFSDYGPGIRDFIKNMPEDERQMYLALAAAIDSIHLTQIMIEQEPAGFGIVPNSTATTLSFLSTNAAIPDSFLKRGGIPKLSNAIMNASHMLNKDALLLLRDAYKENVEALLRDGGANALVAAMTSNFRYFTSAADRDHYLEDLLDLQGKPTMLDAKVALNHGFENIVRQYLEQSSPSESELFIRSAQGMGKGEQIKDILETFDSAESASPSVR